MSGRNRRLGRGRVVGSRGSSNPSSRAGSETEEASMSSSDQSDNGYGDDASLKVMGKHWARNGCTWLVSK